MAQRAPEGNELSVSFTVTPDEADVLIRVLEAAHPEVDHEPVFENIGVDANVALAFAQEIRRQAQRSRAD